MFGRLANDSMESKLGAFAAKGYFQQSALCHLAGGDTVAATNVVEAAKNKDYTFGSSRECQFLERLIQVRYLT